MGGRTALSPPFDGEAQSRVDSAIDHVDHFSMATEPTLMHHDSACIDHLLSTAQSHGGFAPIDFKQQVFKASGNHQSRVFSRQKCPDHVHGGIYTLTTR
jgi:hypothetical protein